MNRPRWWLVVPALLASAVFSVAAAAEIRDKAGLFSADAVKKAQAELDRFEKEYAVPTTIETVDSLDGDSLAQVLNRHAQAVGTEGVYILIPKKEHQILAEASKHYREYLNRSRMKSVEDAFTAQFKAGDFDAGLTQGLKKMDTVFTDAKSASGGTIRQNTAPNTRRGGAAVPARRAPVNKPASGGFGMTLIAIVLGILAIMVVLRIIGALMRMMTGGGQYGGSGMMGGRGGYPGPGGPGYGGGYGGAPAGGGGFMSSLFGGIGGALAGNYLYDQFSGRNHGGVADQTGYDAGAGAAPLEGTSPEWSGNDAGTDWGGGASTEAPAGGDWGGGGGGDWGGGGGDVGGGGDWGGGGGGDDGGSW